jgi:rhodanese-related sulfurtransferase
MDVIKKSSSNPLWNKVAADEEDEEEEVETANAMMNKMMSLKEKEQEAAKEEKEEKEATAVAVEVEVEAVEAEVEVEVAASVEASAAVAVEEVAVEVAAAAAAVAVEVEVEVASPAVLAALAIPVLILDVRDPEEVSAGKGGPPGSVPGSVNVPLNIDGAAQRDRRTSLEEFRAKMEEKGVALPEDMHAAIVTHCGSGGRGGKAAALLRQAGYTNVHNGGGPANVAKGLAVVEAEGAEGSEAEAAATAIVDVAISEAMAEIEAEKVESAQ